MAQVICETVVYGWRGNYTDPDAIMHGPGLIPPDAGWDDVEQALNRRFPGGDETSASSDGDPSDHECDWMEAVAEWRDIPAEDELSFV